MKKIDVIIPTIMNADFDVFGHLIMTLKETLVVNRIIVIDNTEDQSFRSRMGILANPFYNPKLTIINGHKHGFYVNGAWNRGMLECWMERTKAPYYCLLNDDIILDPWVIDRAVSWMNTEEDLSLLTCATVNNLPIVDYIKDFDCGKDQLTHNIPNGRQGWFMVGIKRQWSMIPPQLKLFYGDDYIYRNAKIYGKVGMMTNPIISHFRSSSVNKNMNKLKPIIDQDTNEWAKLCQSGAI